MKRKLIPLLLSSILIMPATATFAKVPAPVSTYVGNGVNGFDDGSKTEAQFNFPSYATIDVNGNIYVSDAKNHRIRKIDANGNVTTVAGTVSTKDRYGQLEGGHEDGAIRSAMFNEPKGIAVDANGTIYVADSKNGAIRKIENQTVSTIAEGLNLPTGLVLGKNGELYVSETLNHQIVKISKDGEKTIVAGGGYAKESSWLKGGYKDGVGESAQFNEPTGLAISDDGTIYVADSGNQRIRSISTTGAVNTIAGSGTKVLNEPTGYLTGGYVDGPANNAKFNFPQGVHVTSDGTIYVADTLNHTIRKITNNGQVTTVIGKNEHGFDNGIGNATFDHPYDVVTLANDNIAVVDYWNHSIRVIDFELQDEINADDDINVFYKDKKLNFDVEPIIQSGRTMVPFRVIAEELGYKVKWNDKDQTIRFMNGNEEIVLKIGSKQITGDRNLTMDVAPFIQDGRTLVPLRFISEAFDKEVKWYKQSRTISIY